MPGVNIKPRSASTQTETRVRSIIAYLKSNHRWVSIPELIEHFGYPYEVVYISLATMRILGMVEEGRQVLGKGRPRAAFHWINNRPHVTPEAAPAHGGRGRPGPQNVHHSPVLGRPNTPPRTSGDPHAPAPVTRPSVPDSEV